MMKKLLLLLFLPVCAMVVHGQQDDVKKKINKIKKSSAYISAEATLPDEDEALKIANELFDNEVNEWVKAKQKGKTAQRIVLRDLNSCTQTISMRRGNNVRAFVYIKKTNIFPLHDTDEFLLNPEEEQDLTDLQEIEEMAKTLHAETAVEPVNPAPTPPRTVNELLHTIKSAKTMEEMKVIFSALKDDGRIVYGTYPAENLSGSYSLLFYTRSGEIKGVVAAKDGRYTDLNSGKEVKLSVFSGCGAYWFELK